MRKYFRPFVVKRFEEVAGGWSDGEGEWVELTSIDGHIRLLSGRERSDLPDINTTHRFYTEDNILVQGDRLALEGKEYHVGTIDHKQIKTSAVNFIQVDCEGLQ